MIDAHASQVSYIAHLGPVMAALPEERRGRCYLGMNYYELADAVERYGMVPGRARAPANREPFLVAGGIDLMHAEGRPAVMIEHGAGQTYPASPSADHQGYSGGRGRDQVRLFLCNNPGVMAANLATYPNARAVVVGDPTIPEMTFGRIPEASSFFPEARTMAQPPIVAVSWHFDIPGLGIPETRSSWPFWADAALKLAETYEVLGHAHPRAPEILRWWQEHRIMTTDDFRDVQQVASLVVVDNSSIGPEFARTGRPILWLNAPSYRRDVNQGGRFWDWTEWAECCDDPDDLVDAVGRALTDPPERQAARMAATSAIYPYIGTDAAARSVAAILEL